MNKTKKINVDYLKSLMVTVSKKLNIHAGDVTVAQLKNEDSNVTEWVLRDFGGITGLRKYFPKTSKDLAEIKKQKDLQSYINALEKQVGQKINYEKQLINTLNTAFLNLKPKKVQIKKPKKTNKKKMTMELMLSDIHYGKKTNTFNLEICKNRMQKLSSVFLAELKNKENTGYQVEHIIIALIGDIIESYTMHGTESALNCEFGNSRQIQEAIDSIFHDVIAPIAQTGIKITVPAVCGNHDRTETNRTYNDPGENYVTWIIYNALRKYCELSGLKNVKFKIPKNNYTTVKIYRDIVLYEHFEELKNTTEESIKKLIIKRAEQTGERITMARGGHWHRYVCYDRGIGIINESACGQDSYASVKGYNSKAGQTINFYVNDKSLPNDFLYSYPVSLG
jgi:predicted MPP superfamily phosphohydrolase